MTPSPRPSPRTATLARHTLAHRTLFMHRVMVVLLVVEWIIALGLAEWVSPSAWHGRASFMRSHFPLALAAGPLLDLVPIALVVLRPQDRTTRWAVTVAQMAWGALFIHLMGGRIETHFHVFVSLALLGFYGDWTVIAVGAAFVAGDHFVRGLVASESVYGSSRTEWWRFAEHAVWVVLESSILYAQVGRSQREVWANAERTAALEEANDALERAGAAVAEADAAQRAAEIAVAVAEEARKDEHQVLETRMRFLAMLSHELRTPLNGVVGYLELLGRTGLAEPQRELMSGASASARHMLELINDFLDFAKITAGRLEVAHSAFSLHETVEHACSVVARAAAEKGLELVVEVDPATPDSVAGDALRVRQILVNLLSNAVKFTARGRIVLRVRAAGDVVDLEVEDQGVGIPADRLARIFEPFRQADAGVAHEHGGTGLGLAISRRLAVAMDGDLFVRSVVGAGSTFTLRVRFDAVERAVTPTRISQLAPAAPGRALRVLLADDNAVNRSVGKQLLEALGHRADVAPNGKIALEMAQAHTYDVVILDVEMPVLDGLAAARALRAGGSVVPILGFTAHTDVTYREACIEAGMNAVVHKPLDLEKLGKALHHVATPGREKRSGPGATRPTPRRRSSASPDPIDRARSAREARETAAVAPAEPEVALFDVEDLVRRVGGDRALAREVLDAVRTDSVRLVEETQRAFAEGDAEHLRRAAHTLKGCVSNVSANALVDKCAELERLAQRGDLAACAPFVPEVVALHRRLHEGLSAHVWRPAA